MTTFCQPYRNDLPISKRTNLFVKQLKTVTSLCNILAGTIDRDITGHIGHIGLFVTSYVIS